MKTPPEPNSLLLFRRNFHPDHLSRHQQRLQLPAALHRGTRPHQRHGEHSVQTISAI